MVAGGQLIVAATIAGVLPALVGGIPWFRASRRKSVALGVALLVATASLYGGHRALGGNGYRCQPSPFERPR